MPRRPAPRPPAESNTRAARRCQPDGSPLRLTHAVALSEPCVRGGDATFLHRTSILH
jgi:hypothetical protein